MARISWGRRAAPERRVGRSQIFFVALAILIGLATPVDGFVHVSIIDAEAHLGIQRLLDQHLRTIESRNQFHYSLTLARKSEPHTRCMTEQFARGDERAAELRPYRLVRLEETARESSLVRAYVQQRDGVVVEYVRRAQLVNILTLPPFDIRRVTDLWYLAAPEGREAEGEREFAESASLSICSREALEAALERAGGGT